MKICYSLFIVNQFECINNGNCIPIYVFLDSLFLNSLETQIHSYSICENGLTLYVSPGFFFSNYAISRPASSYFFFLKQNAERGEDSFFAIFKTVRNLLFSPFLHVIQSNSKSILTSVYTSYNVSFHARAPFKYRRSLSMRCCNTKLSLSFYLSFWLF